MTTVLVATAAGCRAFTEAGESKVKFAGRQVCALTGEAGGACLAVVDGKEIWRRSADAEWSRVAVSAVDLSSIASIDGTILVSTTDVGLMRVSTSGDAERLTGFDTVAGRSEWFGQGPPLHVRALTATADGTAIMAAVHVGGIPRSTDGGVTWAPTVPIDYDVHEVKAHPSWPNIVAGAAAVGLCLSRDGGLNWQVFADGPEVPHSLTLAFFQDEVLFSVQDGPFAERSQIWRCNTGATELKPVREGLPQWLNGKVDTSHMAAGDERAAIVDGGGNLWLSKEGSSGWDRIATEVPYSFGMLVL